MRAWWFSSVVAVFIASCGQPSDPVVGRWYAAGATFEFTRDGTWLMTLDQPNALFQGMSGRWSKTESGSYILVSDPLPLGNTATLTAEFEGSNLVMNMMGQSVRLSRDATDTQSNSATSDGVAQPPAELQLPLLSSDMPVATIHLTERSDGGYDAVLECQGRGRRTFILRGRVWELNGQQTGNTFTLVSLLGVNPSDEPLPAGTVFVRDIPTSHELGDVYRWRTASTQFPRDHEIGVSAPLGDRITYEIVVEGDHLAVR